MKKKDYCKIHNEPKNIITDRYGKLCVKCYLEISKKRIFRKRKVENQITIFDKLKGVV